MRKSITILRLAVFVMALAVAFAHDAGAVTITWSTVGNPGNVTDPATGSLYGAVGYSYNIGTYDVTNSQYVEFLNAKDPTGTSPLQLYNGYMSSAPYGGINYNAGNADGNKYSVISGDGNHPVNWVTWYDTLRFANWLNNGQGNGDTETGAYTLGPLGAGGVPINGDSITRSAGATVFLPSENEWYKAAFYNPGTNSYYKYPTSSNATPNAASPTATPNSANYSGVMGNLTDVGAYTGTASPYGAFDMGGNVFQLNEAWISGSLRGVRGGSRGSGSDYMPSSFRIGVPPGSVSSDTGFRVAETPEPSTGVLAALGLAGLAAWGWRRKR